MLILYYFSAITCRIPCTEISISQGWSHFILQCKPVILLSWFYSEEAEELVQRHILGPVPFLASVIQLALVRNFYIVCVEVAPTLRPFILSSPYQVSGFLFSLQSFLCGPDYSELYTDPLNRCRPNLNTAPCYPQA